MIIKRLTLQNYRRFEKLDLEFPENVIGIIGRNGAGKSTIVEAMSWVLYGNRFVRTDKQDVRSQHVDAKKICSAEMIFTFGGSEYRIVRQLKGKNAVSEAAIYRDNQPEAEAVQDRGVNEFIENLLQLDYRSFTTSVFAQQKELAKLASLQPEQRRQAINRLINIDLIDRAREQVRRDRNEKMAFIQGKESSRKDIDELEEQQKALQDEKKQQRARLIKAGEEVKEKTTQLELVKKDFEHISQLRDQFQNWQSQISSLQSRLEEVEKNKKRLEEELKNIESAEKELSAMQNQLGQFESVKEKKEHLDAAYKKYNQLEKHKQERIFVESSIQKEHERRQAHINEAKQVESLEKAINQFAKKEKEIEDHIDELTAGIKDAAANKKSAEKTGTDLKEKLQRIEELGPEGECPVCTQRLGDHYNTVVADHQKKLEELRMEFRHYQSVEKKHTESLNKLKQELRNLRKEKEQQTKKWHNAQHAAKTVEEIDSHIKNYQQQLQTIDETITKIGPVKYDEKEHNEINKHYDELVDLRQKAAQLQERAGRRGQVSKSIEHAKESLTDLQKNIRHAEEQKTALNYDENVFQQQKKHVDDKSEELNAAREKQANVQKDIAILDNKIENSEKEIKEQYKLRQEIKETETEIAYLNALEEHFGRFRLELAGRIRPLIAGRASELLGLTTTSRYTTIDLDPDYNIRVFDGNLPYPLERFSGGEQDLVNLCLRIAISQVVAERSGGAPINFIVLDEIFGSQDSERRDLILNALSELSSQFRQIFIITHIETIKDMLPFIVNVESFDDQVSMAVAI